MSNNIDKLFKTKAGDIPVDDGMMEQDWEAMKTLLVPASLPAAKPAGNMLVKKMFLAVAVVTTAVVLVYKLSHKQPPVNNAVAVTSNNMPQSSAGNNTTGDTLVFKAKPATDQVRKARIVIDTANTVKGQRFTAKLVVDSAANPVKPYEIKLITNPHIDTPKKFVLVVDTARRPATQLIIKSDKEILDSFYEGLQTPTQLFTIDNTKDTTITGRQGTQITIPANSFTLPNNQPINKNITIQVDEVYSYADIIAHKLYTISDDMPLVSGGMVNITASAGTQGLKLAANKQLSITMPADSVDTQMQLFLPTTNANNATPTGWVPATGFKGYKQDVAFSNQHIVTSLDYGTKQVNLFRRSHEGMVKVLNLQNHPVVILNKNGKTVAKFRAPNKCKLTNDQLVTELSKRYPGYNEIKIRRFRHRERRWEYRDVYAWDTIKPSMLDGEKIFIGDTVWVPVATADKFALWSQEQKTAYYQRNVSSMQYNRAVDSIEHKYHFKLSTLGWMNCDRFYDDRRHKVQYAVDLGNNAEYYTSTLIFPRYKMALAGVPIGNKIVFNSVPEGEIVQLVSIGIKNKKVVACIKSLIISKEVVTGIEYDEVNVGDLGKNLHAAVIK